MKHYLYSTKDKENAPKTVQASLLEDRYK